MHVETITSTRDELGESALWDAVDGALYWLDLADPTLHRWSEVDGVRSVAVPLPAPLGALLPSGSPDHLVLAAGHRLHRIDRRTAAVVPIGPELDLAGGTHINDAKTDSAGEVWLATADDAESAPAGRVLRADGQAAPGGFVVANGPAFSPDGTTMYVSDSVRGRVLAYPVQDGVAGDSRELARFTPDEGLPDGLTVDAEGGIWVAHWDAARLTRLDPAGRRTVRVGLPARHVTSAVFGGPDLTDLFVTSARYELDAEEMARHPESGSVFRLRPGVRGLPARPARVASDLDLI